MPGLMAGCDFFFNLDLVPEGAGQALPHSKEGFECVRSM